MSKYLKLVNFEIHRFLKLYFALIGMIVILQFSGVVVKSLSYIHQANRAVYEQGITKAQFITRNGPINFMQIMTSMWFLAPIAISATVILGYIFLIWYRDWFAKNTFIYRLLMLPTSRLSIYFSKSTAILLMVLGLITLEIIILPFQLSLFQLLVPNDLRLDLPLMMMVSGYFVLYTIIPGTFTQFVLYYATGLMVVLVLFTAILFERCYRWKGVLLAVLYCGIALLVFISPVIYLKIQNHISFYPDELLTLYIALGLLIMGASIWISGVLLKKKITV
ncbi:hypothetical protein HPT25_12455 [Bacillus sp. BRMEA1]|uniref:hypothetical protein n=1 Tax=Neobacillus endophyticus TaxID=2738405 RepID=UPI001566954E|nr:hypothetical protein [Neobacillus endophyticus]NRD78198.1 hypothetical protein [Neobacillus endophyticus]